MKIPKEKLTLDYFKGIFHTYAIQNNPRVNIYYSFDIFDFKFKRSIKESFIENFTEFKGMEFKLERITKDDFVKTLDKWFFMEFNPNSIKHIPNSEIVNDIVNDLVYSFEISNFYKIPSIKKENNSMEKEFGLLVDFVIISSSDKAFYCEFLLDG